MWSLAGFKKKLLLFLSLLLFAWSGLVVAQEKIVGYYPTWNQANLPYNNIEYSNLTHIIVAFAPPLASGVVNFSGLAYPQLVNAAHAGGVKMLISVGGADSGPSFSVATADSVNRVNFINSVATFLEYNSYDGIDIDWESPSDSADEAQLTSLIQGLRAKFNQLDSSWLITMAIPPTANFSSYFDYPQLTSYVNWYNVMCYDFVGSWCTYTGHDSPLYYNTLDPNAGADSNSVLYLYDVGRGIPKSKLVIGVPFYADQFNAPGLFQKLTNNSVPNVFYADIVTDIDSGWTYHWDNMSEVPWLENPAQTEFITYEDTNSIKLKVQYCVRQQLGGIMIWEITQDLYNGTQPLLETMGRTLKQLTSVTPGPTVVSSYKLYNNFPNPFNPTTVISYQLSANSYVMLKVYDVLGREVATLVDGQKLSGKHEVNFDGNKLSSGVYFYSLAVRTDRSGAGSFSQTKKMLLIK